LTVQEALGEGADDIGRRIQAARVLAGLSRVGLARTTAIGERQLRGIEYGDRRPSSDDVARIAAATGLPLAFFSIDLSALEDPLGVIAAQLREVDERLARIEISLDLRGGRGARRRRP
jgi:transcriptional regulator with XRE-family HTH domain